MMATSIGDQRYALIKDYAANFESVEETKAQELIQRAQGIRAPLPTGALGQASRQVLPDRDTDPAPDRPSSRRPDTLGSLAAAGWLEGEADSWNRVGTDGDAK